MTDGNRQAKLTPAQGRMWAGQRTHPTSPLYNMALAYRISGALSESAFRDAFTRLVEEVDALRMIVVEAGDSPSQASPDHVEVAMDVIDLRDHLDPEAEAEALMRERFGRAFDLQLRSYDCALLRAGEDEWIWFYNQHHMFSDASSFAVLFARLGELYSQALGVSEAVGPPLPGFLDHLSRPSERTDAALAHFAQRRLSPPRLYGQGSGGTTCADRVPVAFGTAQSEVLRNRAKDRRWAALTPQMSMYTMLATVLFAFLHRVSAQNRLSIGSPVHNRATPAARRTAGLLIDILPLAVEVAPDDTFETLFNKVSAETSLFLRHASAGPADSALHRSFNAVLNFITARFGDFAGLPTRSEWLHPGHCDPNHQLRLQVEDFDATGAFRLFLDLNRDTFADPETVAAHFGAILEAFLSDPGQPIAAVALATADEATRLSAFANGPVGPSETRSIPDLIAERCAATPEAPAIRDCDTTMTYAALEARVEAQAALLQAHGVGPGTRVGLVLPRCPAAVVAMIATMRCGAAYVPVDPMTPDERLLLILKDADCAAILALSAEVPGALVIDRSGTPSAAVERAFHPVEIRPGSAAYLLYTSGTTGQPKGVIVSHRGLSHYVGWARDTYCGTDRLTFPLFSPLTFDLTVTSLFVPLVTGGALRIYGEPASGPDLTVLDVFAEDGVDIVKLTPSHLRLLSGRNFKDARIRQLIVGGEDFSAALAHEIDGAFGGHVAIHNEYGPTEATVGCIVHTFDPKADRLGSVPIGRPIANMTALVLNAQGLQQPVGVEGELYLAGPGLADGYHRRPDMTAAAFLPIPPGLGDGTMYRTGDLARLRDDGIIEYLGRIDQQVKVNGVRIETGEIESGLIAFPGIESACAVLQDRARGRSEDVVHCLRCGLPSTFPDVRFDGQGICSICREFEGYRDSAQGYFQDMPALAAILDEGLPAPGRHDCVALFSGGKDSTYMVGRLADMGLRVLAFTLDNGFISQQAKANIERVVSALNVDHVYGDVPGMNRIFADSLRRHSNVCNGCFKVIYTLGMQLALDRQIPFVFTGLSRGQFFETRLSPELFSTGAPQAEDIDAMVLEARKTYHRTEDAVSTCLDVGAFRTDEIFEKVRVVDFYRYCDVGLDDLYAYLDARLPWVRPNDTGRSTNCRINDVGIYVHKKERGYHNYALPYSWDVRMGHKDRDAALKELDDEIDTEEVHRILTALDYRPAEPETTSPELVTYYAAPDPVPEADLHRHLATRLASYMLPTQFIHLPAMPLSRNGKVNRSALPEPPSRRAAVETEAILPRNAAEVRMAGIWEDVLGTAPIGVHDDFFDLGGDFIAAIRINTRALKAGFDLKPNDLFDTLTIERLVARAEQGGTQFHPAPVPPTRGADEANLKKLAGLLGQTGAKG